MENVDKDYLLNRKVTIFFGISFLFVFFAEIISEIMSLFLDEHLLAPGQFLFHFACFIGYVITLIYVFKKQPYIEEKNKEIINKLNKTNNG